MLAKQILCLDKSRIYGQDSVRTINLSQPSVASAAVCSKALVLLMLIHCLLLGGCDWFLFCYAVL